MLSFPALTVPLAASSASSISRNPSSAAKCSNTPESKWDAGRCIRSNAKCRYRRRNEIFVSRSTVLYGGSRSSGLVVKAEKENVDREKLHVGEEGGKKGAKRIVVLGGTGRVGGSTTSAIASMIREEGEGMDVDLVISGRNREKGEAICWQLGGGASFSPCDIEDEKALRNLIDGADLVVHTAGPFQRKQQCSVLEAAITTRTPYLDVCDDVDFSQRAKTYHQKAVDAGVPAVTTAGIYPGVSNIMAAEMVRTARRGGGEGEEGGGKDASQPKSLKFSYYTAGSGGAGPTILATSFLLLGEETLAFRNGEEVRVKAYSGHRVVDFGPGIGPKSCYLLNLPEVVSTHRILGVPSVSARFGTSPEIWNWAMQAMVSLVPAEVLRDREKVGMLVRLSDPFVRLADKFSGEKVGMRVDLETTDGKVAVGIYSHKSLSRAVGQSTAAFALSMLEGQTEAGVWFPEEGGAVPLEHRAKLLQRASKGTICFLLNKPPWMIEKTPKQLGFGLYF